MATAARGGNKLMALWKQGWNEIPEVMGSGFYGVIGAGFCVYYVWKAEKYDLQNHRYKKTYIVYRPEDMRNNRVKKFEDSPKPTRTPACLRC